jgi:tRNA A37 threonylcarbamoyladenosine synthetase subunit TsaC/SUA5/YrdC
VSSRAVGDAIITAAGHRDDADVVLRAADALRAGEVVMIPTDTVYGLAAALDRPDAIDRLYAIKGRPAEKAIPVLISETTHVHMLTPRLSETVAILARSADAGAAGTARSPAGCDSARRRRGANSRRQSA